MIKISHKIFKFFFTVEIFSNVVYERACHIKMFMNKDTALIVHEYII